MRAHLIALLFLGMLLPAGCAPSVAAEGDRNAVGVIELADGAKTHSVVPILTSGEAISRGNGLPVYPGTPPGVPLTRWLTSSGASTTPGALDGNFSTPAVAGKLAPTTSQRLYVCKLMLNLAHASGLDDPLLWGGIAALTNGYQIRVYDTDDTTVVALIADKLTANVRLAMHGAEPGTMWNGTTDYKVYTFDFVRLFGGCIVIDGSLGHDLQVYGQDNTTTMADMSGVASYYLETL